MSMRLIKKLVLNTMLVALSILFALGATEAVFRLTHYKEYLLRSQFYGYPKFYFRADDKSGFDISENFPVRMFHFADGDTRIWSNEMGCFDYPYRNEKDYILLAGDSFTWGYAPFETKFGNIIENYSGHRVLKCGVSGYGTRQETIKIRQIVAKTGRSPSLIIVGYCMGNDLKDDYLFPHATFQDGYLLNKSIIANISTGEKKVYSEAELKSQLSNWKSFGSNRRPADPDIQRLNWWLKKNFLFYNIISHQGPIKDLESKIMSAGNNGPSDNEYKLFNNVMPYVPLERYPWLRSAWSKHLRSLEDISEFSRASGAKLLIVLIPMKEQVYDFLRPSGDYHWTQPDDMLIKYLGKHSIAFLDLMPLFREFVKTTGSSRTGHKQDLYWKNDPHWSIKGNGLAGLFVTRYLIDNNLIAVADRQKTRAKIDQEINNLATGERR
jgi:hypothetical protein